MALAVAVLRSADQEPAVEEYRVKGAYLLNFAKFVEWPERAFKGPGDPINVCILGASPFSPSLEAAAHSIVVEKHPVVVKLIPDPPQARQCQIVFVSVAERRHVRGLLQEVQGGNVLTVGETEGFLAEGGGAAVVLFGGAVLSSAQHLRRFVGKGLYLPQAA